MTCTEDPTTEMIQMNTTYTSVDEPITLSSVLSLDRCEAICAANVSQCSTIEYLHNDKTCNIYQPSTRQRFPRYVTQRKSTTVSSNICWKGMLIYYVIKVEIQVFFLVIYLMAAYINMIVVIKGSIKDLPPVRNARQD